MTSNEILVRTDVFGIVPPVEESGGPTRHVNASVSISSGHLNGCLPPVGAAGMGEFIGEADEHVNNSPTRAKRGSVNSSAKPMNM
jgi:hypothetical protein